MDEYLRDRDTILRELGHSLSMANQCMKCQTDKKRREVFFEVVDYKHQPLTKLDRF